MQGAISGTFFATITRTATTVPGGYDNIDFAFVLHGAGGGELLGGLKCRIGLAWQGDR